MFDVSLTDLVHRDKVGVNFRVKISVGKLLEGFVFAKVSGTNYCFPTFAGWFDGVFPFLERFKCIPFIFGEVGKVETVGKVQLLGDKGKIFGQKLVWKYTEIHLGERGAWGNRV